MKKLFYLILFFSLACSKSDSPGVSSSSGSESSINGGSGSGTGGSTARFTIAGNHLYIVTTNTLYSFALSDLSKPELKSEIQLNTFVETIFPFNGHLLLGTQTGVLIYSLSNPDRPSYTSIFEHVVSCDPVIARGDYAYSTLRVASGCNRGVNQLQVLDISDFQNPILKTTRNLTNPIGLGLSGDYLFVCDNNQLLRFDVSTANNPVLQNPAVSLEGCFDIIPVDDLLIVATTQGISQYRVATDGTLSLLSTIKKG